MEVKQEGNSKVPSPTWPGRVWRFSRQMFPLYPNAVILWVQFMVSYSVIGKFLVEDAPRSRSSLELWIGGITSVLLVYLLRVFDEIKDYPTDKVNFPDRPLVVGVMSLKDVRILWISVILLLFILQVPFFNKIAVLVSFVAIMIYQWLSFKWFFCEKQIRASLPLALITHNPLVYWYQLYILSFYIRPEVDSLSTLCLPILYLIGDGLVGTAWEISRKIRGKQDEDTYVTYSKIWGPFIPTLLVGLLMSASWGLTLYSFWEVVKGSWAVFLWGISAGVIVLYGFAMARYVRSPEKSAPPFRVYVEIFKASILITATVILFAI